MKVSKTKTVKKILSWTLGIPAGFLVVCEVEDLKYCWIQLVALIVVMALLTWNHAFETEKQ